MKEVLEGILKNYLPVRSLDPKQKARLKELVDIQLTNEVKNLLTDRKSLKIKGRTQQGKWADVPWVGIHDSRIDSSAQSGIYLTILFNVDGSSVSLSIQHGTEGISLSEIDNKVKELSKEFFLPNELFTRSPLNLRGSIYNLSNSSRPAKYERANLIGRTYTRESIPESITEDLLLLMDVYDHWIAKSLEIDNEKEYQIIDLANEEPVFPIPPKRIERKFNRVGLLSPARNKKEGVIALKRASYKCEADPTHITFLNEDGRPFMEKHHLIPMENYFDFDLSIDHFFNIYSLCPTCHRKIHYGIREEKEELIEKLFNSRSETYLSFYKVTLNKIYSMY